MVYDCGVLRKQTPLKQKIKDFCQNIGDKTPIDLLCISHFDEDHVIGLEALCEDREVKNILVPLLTVYDIFLLLGNSNFSQFTLVSDVLYDVYHPNGNKYARVIEVSPSNSEDTAPNNDEPNSGSIYLDEEAPGRPDRDTPTQRKILNNRGVLLISSKLKGLNWEFKPFFMCLGLPNYFKDSLKKELRNLLGVSSQDDANLKKELLAALSAKNIKHTQIKKAYQKVIDPNKKPEQLKGVDINPYSLCLYSGAKNEIEISRRIISAPGCTFCSPYGCYLPCWENHYFWKSSKTGCLYLGDYNAKTEKYLNPLCKHYQAYARKADVLQIPHHGSVKNWSIALPIFFNPNIAFTQAGLHNTYGHPNPSVIKESSRFACTSVITEDTENLTILCEVLSFNFPSPM